MKHIDISKLRICDEPYEDSEVTKYYLSTENYDTACQIEFECCRRCGIFANEYDYTKVYALFIKDDNSCELHIVVENLEEWRDNEVPLTNDEKESLISFLKEEKQRFKSGKNKKGEIER